LKNNPRITQKERGLLKGALRRVFSRSELRKAALDRVSITFNHPDRPRVTKWGFCERCGVIDASYKLEVDHLNPVIPLYSSLSETTLDELADRIWCEIEQLNVLCESCHKEKTSAEAALRNQFKKEQKLKNSPPKEVKKTKKVKNGKNKRINKKDE